MAVVRDDAPATLLDLVSSVADEVSTSPFLIAPDGRETNMRSQLKRPVFSAVGRLTLRYLPKCAGTRTAIDPLGMT